MDEAMEVAPPTPPDSGRRPEMSYLPPEILLSIFSRCPSLDVATQVRRVSRHFYNLVVNDAWWMTRIQKSSYQIQLTPSQLAASDFSAWRTVHALEVEAARWIRWGARGPRARTANEASSASVQRGDVEMGETPKVATDAHAGTVDTVRLFQNSSGHRFCLSAGRDRAIKLWDVDRVQSMGEKKEWLVGDKQVAHSGWIWSIDRPTEGQFYTCGWDCQVKLWQIEESNITEVVSARVPSAAMCVVSGLNVAGSSPSVVVVGTFCRRLFFFDARAGPLAKLESMPIHKKAVFGLAHDNNCVYSCGEDHRIVKMDCRNVNKPVTEIILDNYALGFSLRHGQLIAGTQRGMVIAFNANDLSEEYRFPVSTQSVRCVVHTRATIHALSKDRKLSVYTVGSNPKLLGVSKQFDSEPTRFDLYKGDVVVGGGDGSLTFWPKPQHNDYPPLT